MLCPSHEVAALSPRYWERLSKDSHAWERNRVLFCWKGNLKVVGSPNYSHYSRLVNMRCARKVLSSQIAERESFCRKRKIFFFVLVGVNHLDLTQSAFFFIFCFPPSRNSFGCSGMWQLCLAQEGSLMQDERKHCKNDCCFQLSQKCLGLFFGGFSKYAFVIVIVSLLDRLCILNTQMSQRSQV